jgi:hypothetical protein
MKSGMKAISAMSVVTLLVACAGTPYGQHSRIAVMQNPETKQTVECRADPWGDMNYRRQIDNCIKAYEGAGYVIRSDVGP